MAPGGIDAALCKAQGVCQAKEVRQGVGQGERLPRALQGLVRIAEYPQGPGRVGEATHSRVMAAIKQGVRAVLLGIVKGPPLLQVGLGRGKLSSMEQGGPQRVVGLQEERRVADLLG